MITNRVIVLLILIGWISLSQAKRFTIEEITLLPVDRTATDPETMMLDVNDSICAVIKLPFPKVDENVITGDHIFKKIYHGNEWYIYMPPQTYKFYIKYPGYDDLDVDLSRRFPKGVESGKTYKVIIPYDEKEIKSVLTPILNPTVKINENELYHSYQYDNSDSGKSSSLFYEKKSLFNKNEIFIQAGYNIIGLQGFRIGLGGYFSNVNLETNFIFGLAKSENIYWNDTTGEEKPIESNYNSKGFDIKAGYGILIAKRLRLTPQIGITYVVLQESSDVKIANNANAICFPINIKAEMAIVKHFAISLEPTYKINIRKSDGYKILSEISNKIKGYSNGFEINISLNCYF